MATIKAGAVMVEVDDEDRERLFSIRWTWDGRYAVFKGLATGYKKLYLHRYIMNAPVGLQVDHIDRNPLNCRRNNLRLVLAQQNSSNHGLPSNNTSGYKGVTWFASRNKYRAYIKSNGKQIHIGYFSRLEDAAQAYNFMARRLFGQYASYNLPRCL